MKITLYELLGLVKDGQAPKRFIKDNVLWYKGKSDTNHYYCENGKCQLNYIKLSELNDEIELIDNEVEILDNEDEEKNKVPTEEEMEILGYNVAKIVKAFQKGVNIALEENDNEDEDIEEIKHKYIYGLNEKEEEIDDRVSELEEKINELLRKVNKLKKGNHE